MTYKQPIDLKTAPIARDLAAMRAGDLLPHLNDPHLGPGYHITSKTNSCLVLEWDGATRAPTLLIMPHDPVMVIPKLNYTVDGQRQSAELPHAVCSGHNTYDSPSTIQLFVNVAATNSIGRGNLAAEFSRKLGNNAFRTNSIVNGCDTTTLGGTNAAVCFIQGQLLER